jgi:hypothetical protein
MPPKKDPESRHSKPAPHTRHKAKPKFEVPVETESPVEPVAWVYRTDDAPAPPPPTAPRQTKGSSKGNPFLLAGMGLFLVGAAAVGFVSLVALGLAAGPMGIGKGLLARDG